MDHPARLLLVVLGLVLAGAVATADSLAEKPDLARGAELLAPFKRDLQQALRAGLAEGPIEAIDACHVKAPEIADARSRKGVRVGRTSDRLRNPANAAPDWVRPLLAAYSSEPSLRTPRAVALDDTRVGYVEPIVLQPVCITCHGETLAPVIESRLRELYPEDRAVGYTVGDLRGVFWIEFPAN